MANNIIGNRYEIRRTLGQGGFSEVFLAYDLTLDREVALKRLFGSTQNEAFQKQRQREKRVYAQLRSKHVVQLYDQLEEGGAYYLVFELMDHSFARYTSPVELTKVLRWAKQLLEGLLEIHACGVVHRDIKPANLFVDRHGSAHLGDFGAAGMEGSMSLAAWTPEYLAREIIEGDPDRVEPNSDLYSLGFVLYKLLLGEETMQRAFPEVFAGNVRDEGKKTRWMMWHGRRDVRAPEIRTLRPDVSPQFSQWLSRMMEKDAARRFRTALEAQETREAPAGFRPDTTSGQSTDVPIANRIQRTVPMVKIGWNRR